MKKQCTACKTVKTISEFHKNTHSGDGYRSACSECVNAIQRAKKQKRERRQGAIKSGDRSAINCLNILAQVARKDTTPIGYYCR